MATLIKTTRIALSGSTGRMGHAISYEVSGREDVDIQSTFRNSDSLDAFFKDADVAIDFSRPEATIQLAKASPIPLLVGTTGLDDDTRTALQLAAKRIPVLVSANTSLGVAVLRHLAKEATRMLGPDYDISITDIHHKEKIDAPSGTAHAIDASIKEARKSAHVQHVSHRIGTVTGEHTVHFAGPSEHLEIRHVAEDRSLFAKGAIRAALWLKKQKPGLYSMDDIIKG